MEQISENPLVQSAYEELIQSGMAPRLAEMLACRRPPNCVTDREFLKGHCSGSQFQDNPAMGNYYKEVAERHGQSTTGKVYLSGLARFPGDPQAWVDGRGDVKRLCEQRGWSADGLVKHTARAEEPPKEVAVAPDIVERELLKKVEANPSLVRGDLDEVRHEIIEERKPHWSSE